MQICSNAWPEADEAPDARGRVDFVAAENSMGFHAPQEVARILGESIDLSRQAEAKAVALTGGKLPVALPPVPVKDQKG